MELVQGMKNRDEFRMFEKQIRKWGTDIIHVDAEISERVMFYVQEYWLNHSMVVADALIAATAIRKSETLSIHTDA